MIIYLSFPFTNVLQFKGELRKNIYFGGLQEKEDIKAFCTYFVSESVDRGWDHEIFMVYVSHYRDEITC